MNRRKFIISCFTILPAAVTYDRVWKPNPITGLWTAEDPELYVRLPYYLIKNVDKTNWGNPVWDNFFKQQKQINI